MKRIDTRTNALIRLILYPSRTAINSKFWLITPALEKLPMTEYCNQLQKNDTVLKSSVLITSKTTDSTPRAQETTGGVEYVPARHQWSSQVLQKVVGRCGTS